MKRVDVQNVEARLRSEQPGEIRAPMWVRTRVIASMDAEAQAAPVRARGTRLRAMLAGGLVFAVVAIAGVYWLQPASPQSGLDGWQTDEPVKIALPSKVRVTLPDGPLEDEVRNIRADVVEFMGVVRVPMEKLTEASKQFRGSV